MIQSNSEALASELVWIMKKCVEEKTFYDLTVMLSMRLLICKLGLVLSSTGSGMKSAPVVLSELSMRLFDLVQAWMLYRYGCICAFKE